MIFVHGFSGTSKETWSNFVDVIRNDERVSTWDLYGIGYPSSLRVDIPGIWSADGDIDILSLAFRTALSLEPLARYQAIAICAHSMGGLVVQRALLDQESIVSHLRYLFLFGTPSAGIVKARLFRRLKRQLRDMDSNSNFIQSLRRDWAKRFPNETPFKLKL